ncbi:MAG: DUF393 domain-containing protein [Planctomycetota bacterium]|nr:DUF393 domain-containing protein [Planctomycetota bacterium]
MSTATNNSTARLPGPDERTNSDVVIYDGHCRICTAQVRKLPWWDCQKKLSYLSLHDPEVQRRYPDLTHDALMKEMYVVDQSGNRHAGADAIRYLTRRLRRLWWAAPALHFPFSRPLWQRAYRWIANRRYQYGKLDQCDEGGTCSLHGPK